MQNSAIIINGKPGSHISSLDRGLLYGDGVFETIAIRKGLPQFWDEHLERLNIGCNVLGITVVDKNLLKDEIERLTNTNEHCVIKIIITRGIGDRGYKPTQQSSTRILHNLLNNIMWK